MKLYLLQVSSQNMDKAALEQLLEETRHDRCIVALEDAEKAFKTDKEREQAQKKLDKIADAALGGMMAGGQGGGGAWSRLQFGTPAAVATRSPVSDICVPGHAGGGGGGQKQILEPEDLVQVLTGAECKCTAICSDLCTQIALGGSAH